jgi:hypothetical protein
VGDFHTGKKEGGPPVTMPGGGPPTPLITDTN